ncbi:hypothetical protein HT031_001579 [Scenedesmus sp. PABB004]|nr:hypothetical protein HT031_001579 [Scenedesmus sp. PABB004]
MAFAASLARSGAPGGRPAAGYATTEALAQLPAAGARGGGGEDTAAAALAWGPRPVTPEVIKPFQHYARAPPGTITRHPGAARDAVPHGPFGVKGAVGEGVGDCMGAAPASDTQRWSLEQREAVYASNRQEPLGRGLSRGHVLPQGLGTHVAFGRPLHEQEARNSTRSIIFPDPPPGGDDAAGPQHRMYVASHGSFAPGEQRSRDYDWAAARIDPARHRFGLILQPELSEQPSPVVSALYEAHKATLGDELARPRPLGARGAAPPGAVFGRPPAREAEPTVGELLRGWYSAEAQAPDPDLGKSLREGWRNTEPAARALGVPSVRVDRPMPARPSVANTQNYGGEPCAAQLLAPPPCVDLGVKAEHLLTPRGAAELAALLESAGVCLRDGELQAALELAARLDGAPAGEGGPRCSLDAFMRARRLLLSQEAGLA